MTRRGQGYNKRLTIEQYRTRQDTERVKSWIVPNAQSQPQPKQRSERASSSGRACTVYIRCTDALADSQHLVGCRLTQAADR